MFELFQKGGIMMYPLALCSMLVVAVFMERLWSLRKKKVLIPEIVTVLEQVKKPEDLSIVRSVCEKFLGPFGAIVIACIDNRDMPVEELRLTIEDEGRQQVRKLTQGLGILETVAGIAPLLGLLGTVLGMIEVFSIIEQLGVGQAKALSGGISEALVTTAVGLFIGIPALVAYNFLNSRSEGLILDIEKYTVLMVNKIIRMGTGSNANVAVDLHSK